MTVSLTSLFAGLAAAALILFVQPLLMKGACSACGEKKPGYFGALFAIFGASLANLFTGGVYALTLGALIAGFSFTASVFGGMVLALLVTGIAYSAVLRIPVSNGTAVAFVHHAFSLLFTGAVALALRTLAGLG